MTGFWLDWNKVIMNFSKEHTRLGTRRPPVSNGRFVDGPAVTHEQAGIPAVTKINF